MIGNARGCAAHEIVTPFCPDSRDENGCRGIFVQFQQSRDIRRIVLAVPIQGRDQVSASSTNSRAESGTLTGVSRMKDNAQSDDLLLKLGELFDGSIGTAVIYVDNLMCDVGKSIADFTHQRFHVVHFVVDRNDNRKDGVGHCCLRRSQRVAHPGTDWRKGRWSGAGSRRNAATSGFLRLRVRCSRRIRVLIVCPVGAKRIAMQG